MGTRRRLRRIADDDDRSDPEYDEESESDDGDAIDSLPKASSAGREPGSATRRKSSGKSQSEPQSAVKAKKKARKRAKRESVEIAPEPVDIDEKSGSPSKTPPKKEEAKPARVSVLKQTSAADRALQERAETVRRAEEARRRLAEQRAAENKKKAEREQSASPSKAKTELQTESDVKGSGQAAPAAPRQRKLPGALRRKLEKRESELENRKAKALAEASADFDCDDCVVYVDGWSTPWDTGSLKRELSAFADNFSMRLVGKAGLAAVVRFDNELAALDAVEVLRNTGTNLRVRKARLADDAERWLGPQALAGGPSNSSPPDSWMGHGASAPVDQKKSLPDILIPDKPAPIANPTMGPASPAAMDAFQIGRPTPLPVSPAPVGFRPGYLPNSGDTRDASDTRNAMDPVFPVSPKRTPKVPDQEQTPRKAARISFLINADDSVDDPRAGHEGPQMEHVPWKREDETGRGPKATPPCDEPSYKPPATQPNRGVRRVQVYDDDV